jgi:hypothetical protein
LDIIRQLDCEVIVVAPNKLGTINHTLLTIRALQDGAASNAPTLPRSHSPRSHSPRSHSPRSTRVVLMNRPSPDASAGSNPSILSELLAPIPVHTFPFLGPAPCRLGAIRTHASAMQQKLAALCRKP